MKSAPTLSEIIELDRQDALAPRRAAFQLPEKIIYLDGNSLGALPLSARRRAQQVVEREWGQDLISSWNQHDWINLPVNVGEKIARLLGAAPGQTICCDSTSVNLFKLLSCALHLQQGRSVVLTQIDNFPADLYIAQGLGAHCGPENCTVKAVAAAELEQHLDSSVAVLLLTHVNYKSAAMHDLQQLTARAHQQGILVLWDLSHSAGAVPLQLDAWQVDFAVGCTYKYLNGGPGAPAFIYAATRHHGSIRQPLTGWMGHTAPFEFAAEYVPSNGVRQFLCGTPAIISMSVLDAALDVFDAVDMHAVRRKSVALTELFLTLATDTAALPLVSPRAGEQRGSHLAFSHPQAYAICQALIAQGVICDFRAPDILRLGFAPLYVRYRDVWDSVAILAAILASKSYESAEFTVRHQVT